MSIYQNTCKPVGLGGKYMVARMNVTHAPMAAWGFRYLPLRPASSALDVGCGGGANVQRLLELSPEGTVTGLDYSAVSVKKTASVNRKAIRQGRCRVVQGDVMALPFREEEFGLVTAFETIYFWPELAGGFREVFRVLQPGGLFLICNGANGCSEKDEKWTAIIRGMTSYTAGQISDALTQAGFTGIAAHESQEGWLCLTAGKPRR